MSMAAALMTPPWTTTSVADHAPGQRIAALLGRFPTDQPLKQFHAVPTLGAYVPNMLHISALYT